MMAAPKRPMGLPSILAVVAATALVLCSEVPQAVAAAQKKSADAGGKHAIRRNMPPGKSFKMSSLAFRTSVCFPSLHLHLTHYLGACRARRDGSGICCLLRRFHTLHLLHDIFKRLTLRESDKVCLYYMISGT